MKKTILSILFLISLNSKCGLLDLFDPNFIRAEAAANIAAQEAAEKAARLQAESDRIAKERGEALVALMKGIGYLSYNTGKFIYKSITGNHSRVLQKLRDGRPEVVAGFIGTVGLTVAGAVAYHKYKNQNRRDYGAPPAYAP